MRNKLVLRVGTKGKTKRKHFLYPRWWSMLSRCYDTKNKCYSSYGKKNIFVCERWLLFDNFIEDVVLLDGYDEELAKKGFISLDKDKKANGIKMYSPETCCWLTNEENSNLSKNTIQVTQRLFLGKRLSDGYEELSNNQVSFAKKFNLSRSKIGEVLSGKYPHHKGWIFKFVQEKGVL